MDKSSIVFQGAIQFTNNKANFGGGVSLERYSQFIGMSEDGNESRMNFISNKATTFGGAVYVHDITNPDVYTANTVEDSSVTVTTECFRKFVFMNMFNNSAGVSGSNLFGGLLDRCMTDNATYNEGELSRPLGVVSFLKSSNISDTQLDTISSQPVRLCVCRGSQPDCENPLESVIINRGNSFSVELIAFDQIHSPVNASIQALLNSTAGGLGEHQQIQRIDQVCTKLQYNIFSPLNFEELTLSILGPCNVSGISEHSITIEITCICPTGFQVTSDDDMPCVCGCHQVLIPYLRTECDIKSQSIIRGDNFWITYINQSNASGFLIHANCPYNYCNSPEALVHVNLNNFGGSDAQCSPHRSGILCGSCEAGYSVSLGSTSCLQCPPYWPGLLATTLVVFIISGVCLVAILLVLNLTVSVGTLNAIIFYANIMAASKTSLFPMSDATLASVFISWLNFDIGFDFCFINGMDTYVKTWLQLAFPAYIFLLVAGIIKLSDWSDTFGRLIGRKDPVGTLATLILLSYAKLLQTIIIAFSSATLTYPDNSKVTVWLPDASLGYFSGKHVALFLAATLVLVACLVYTFPLFTWQWFLCCPRKHLKLITNQKLSFFFETYHHPYTPKHRYWTGLLLLVRVLVYIISAFTSSSDPGITLLSTTFILSCIVVYVAMFRVKIYKYWFINILETLTYFNIITVSLFSWLALGTNNEHLVVVTSLSIGITFIQLLTVIAYHVCRHMNRSLYSKIQESSIYKNVREKLAKVIENKPAPADNDIHPFNDLLDFLDRPVNNDSYNIPKDEQEQNEPTLSFTMADRRRPNLESPLVICPEEINNESQKNPIASSEDSNHVMVVNEQQSALIADNQPHINDYLEMVNLEYEISAITFENGINNSTTHESTPSALGKHTPDREMLQKIMEESDLIDEPLYHQTEKEDNVKCQSANENQQCMNNVSGVLIPECDDCPPKDGIHVNDSTTCKDYSLTCEVEKAETAMYKIVEKEPTTSPPYSTPATTP